MSHPRVLMTFDQEKRVVTLLWSNPFTRTGAAFRIDAVVGEGTIRVSNGLKGGSKEEVSFPLVAGIPPQAEAILAAALAPRGEGDPAALDPRFHLEAAKDEASPSLPFGIFDAKEDAAAAVRAWEESGMWPEGFDAVLTCPAQMERWLLTSDGSWEAIGG